MNKLKINRKGFTLTELLVVVILVGILASLAIPRFGKSTDRAMEAEAKIALRQVQELEKVYYLEHKTFTNNLEKLGFEQEVTVEEDPEHGTARYRVEIVSIGPDDFLAKAVPLVADLRTYTVSKQGKPVVE